MFRHLTSVTILLAFIVYSQAAFSKAVDLFVLLDASAIYEQQDKATVTSVIERISANLDRSSRIGLYTFAVEQPVHRPLQGMNEFVISELNVAIKSLVYDLDNSDPASVIEKAIYNLRSKGREEATKTLLLIGDGRVRTGDRLDDENLTRWLMTDLANGARLSGISVFWLTLSESADYRVIQTLTGKTEGGYFRAFSKPEALEAVDAVLSVLGVSASSTTQPVREDARDRESTASGVVVSVVTTSERWPILLIGTGAFVVLLSALFIAYVIFRRRGRHKRALEESNKAVLRDLAGFTPLKEYDISEKKTYIGRIPREVTEHSTVIVIHDATIGREHAVIEFEDGIYWISDRGSVNGTYVNDRKINDSQRLTNRDRIRFAKFEFEVMLPIHHRSGTLKTNQLDDTQFGSPRDPVNSEQEDITLYR